MQKIRLKNHESGLVHKEIEPSRPVRSCSYVLAPMFSAYTKTIQNSARPFPSIEQGVSAAEYNLSRRTIGSLFLLGEEKLFFFKGEALCRMIRL